MSQNMWPSKRTPIVYPFLTVYDIEIECYDQRYFAESDFFETHIIWKNLPHVFDKSADLLSKRQNHEKNFSKLLVLLKKSEL